MIQSFNQNQILVDWQLYQNKLSELFDISFSTFCRLPLVDFNVNLGQPTEGWERYCLTGTSMSTKGNRQKAENDTFKRDFNVN
jgi:hypothetical protein